MWNWQKLNESGDFGFLNGKSKHTKDTSLASLVYFNALYDTFIKCIGLGYDYDKLIALKRAYLINRSKYLYEDDMQAKMKSKLLKIDIDEKENAIKMKEKGNEAETTILLEQNLGYKLNLKEITVVEYYDYVTYFTKQAKKIQQNG